MSNVNKSSTRNKRPLNSGNAGNSKKKREEIHLVSCRDASCTGCAEGEVELVFTKTDGEHGAEQPMATQLYQFALEESNRSGELTPIARKLFERAIEAFNEEERAYVTASATIDPTAIAELSTENLKHQLLYANCLLTFGQQLSLTDKVQQAIEILKRLSKGGHQSAWIHLGRAQLTAVGMKLERLKQMQSEEEDDSEDDSEDENWRKYNQLSYN
ncbi:hypothetical protein BDF19DRAFT_15423 [Syncephalis fuscata]|nr:hypothetical protein BDF19DRAFT_15423 [Syncephalis fuscata]